MSNLVELRMDGAIATLTLNRPEQRNALSVDLLAALHERLGDLAARIEHGDGPRVVVVTGAGTSFCAGMDLKQVLGEPGAPLKLLTLMAEATIKLRSLGAVTIASVNGAAIGGGCGLTTVCDLAVTHTAIHKGIGQCYRRACASGQRILRRGMSLHIELRWLPSIDVVTG